MNKEQNTPGIERRRFRPYPEYKDSGVVWLATVPASWRTCAVKHRFDIFLGKMLQPELVSAHDLQVPYLKAANIQWENIGLNSLQTMWASKDEIQTGQVAMGDLLVCEGGEVGRAAILTQKPEEPTIIQNALHRVRSQSEMPKFLMYLLEVSASGGWLEVECNKATIQHFTRDKFGSLRIALPSLDEQCRIVSFLDRETAKIDALIEKNERLIELLQEKRTALITQAVTKGLDPTVPMKDSRVAWLGNIPAHWGLKCLKRIVEFRGGGTPSKDNLEYWHGDIPWVSPKDMKVSIIVDTEDKITSQAIRESATKPVPVGAVLLVVRSGILKHSIPVALSGCGVTLNQDLKALLPGPEILPEYVFYLILGMQRELLTEWKKEGATVESLEIDLVAQTPMPLPGEYEQRSIAAFLDRETAKIDALMSKIREAITSLREYRKALVSAAVTGKIDVREA